MKGSDACPPLFILPKGLVSRFVAIPENTVTPSWKTDIWEKTGAGVLDAAGVSSQGSWGQRCGAGRAVEEVAGCHEADFFANNFDYTYHP